MKFLNTIALCALAVALTGSARADDKKTEITGSLLRLAGDKKEFTTQPGGLILVNIPDSGSRQPKDIKVDGGGLKKVATVQGSQTDEGIAKPGGGYTWVLLTAEKGGTFKVKVSYTLNDEKGTKVENEYTVKVE